MLQTEEKKGYAIVQLDNGKVNAINTNLAKALKDKFIELENDANNKGVILTGRPHAFSAGLDIKYLATCGAEKAKIFWIEYIQALQAMVRYSKPFVCAITGYAPAGATILTLCADYRIMGKGEKHVLGMHEFKMSLQIPEILCDIYAYQMGEKNAWEAVQKAQLYNSDEALAMGLVNKSVEVEEVLSLAEKHLKKLMNVLPVVFKQSKQYFRKDLLKIVDRDAEVLAEEFISFIAHPDILNMVEIFAGTFKK